MQVKVLEVRDRMTFIPMLCINVNASNRNDAAHYLLCRAGYACDGEPNIIMTALSADTTRACNNPYCWGDRTFAAAHQYILENWSSLNDGDVVDVEFILYESVEPKRSERFDTQP